MTHKYGSEEDLEINGIKELLKFTPSVVKQYLQSVSYTHLDVYKRQRISVRQSRQR